MSPTLVITGATGFIGRHIAHECLDRGLPVICLHRPASRLPDLPGATWMTFEAWQHSGTDCQALIHAAAIRHRHGVAADAYLRINTELTRDLIRAARNRTGRFVEISSIAVFGWPRALPITDTNPFHPVGPYGRSKVACEEELRRSGLPYAIIRPSITYGPHDTNGMIDKLFRLIQAGKYRLVGNGSNRVQLVYAADLAWAAAETALRPGLDGSEFICTSTNPISMRNLSEQAAAVIGKKLPWPHVPKPVARLAAFGFEWMERAGLLRGEPLVTHEKIDTVTVDRAYDISRMRGLLDWEPPTGYQEGLRRTAEALGLRPS